MFERFTDRSRRVVVLAQEQAHALRHETIGTEHLLLGLVQEGEGVAFKVLELCAVGLESARLHVLSSMPASETASVGHLPFTPRAKEVLELSLREALQLGHNYIGTEHILLGLIREGEGTAAHILINGFGLDLGQIRRTVLDVLSGYQRRQKEKHTLTLMMDVDAGRALYDWLLNLEEIFGPFGDDHPVRPFLDACGEAAEKFVRDGGVIERE